MLLKIVDKKIRQAFSDSAFQYEAFAQLQKEIGRELTKKLQDKEPCTAILDVGMGTGWFSNRLRNFFPEALVVGIDFADGMVNVAQAKYENLKIVQADARQIPFKNAAFDLITSNLAYQWVDDLPGSFRFCYESLKNEGMLCLTLFGEQTLQELFTSLTKTSQIKSEDLPIERLPKVVRIKTALAAAGFQSVKVDCEKIQMHFTDMLELMQWLKKIGANALPREIYVGRDWLLRANDYYKANFNDRWGVYASFEVVWVEAVK